MRSTTISAMDIALTCSVLTHPSQFPPHVWDALRGEPRSSNIVRAHATKAVGQNGASRAARIHSSDTWVICCTPDPNPMLQFIVSCIDGPLGPYPVFIYTPLPSDRLVAGFIQPRIRLIVDVLRNNVAPERVFSVFALDPLADAFATIWMATTHVLPASQPIYYHAKFMHCTKATFKTSGQIGATHLLEDSRPAIIADAQEVAALCWGFAAASEPFVLSMEVALEEALLLIRTGHVWVHTVQDSDTAPKITTIVCATRNTATVSAITKVYTNPSWRSRGYAERLVRYVCEILFTTKENIVLYVAHNNPAAAKVYGRVGFVGFSSSENGSVDSWKEVGFDREMVQLGHW
ncbi:hypothetical protein BC628DRAFT_880411 [Trametes gibbosa]|nr:hypothetical protein BC628DRAFT_880411 [Trametes gibbosa]